jgi:hypothetical protein
MKPKSDVVMRARARRNTSEAMSELLPPRLRDWKKGVPQVGVFLRTEQGSVIQWVRDKASPSDVALAIALIGGDAPSSILGDLRRWWEEDKKRRLLRPTPRSQEPPFHEDPPLPRRSRRSGVDVPGRRRGVIT